MSATSFYVQKPTDVYWSTPMTDVVIEASAIDPKDPTLLSYQKTDEYVRDYLKVIDPKDFKWNTVKKSSWMPCKGPSMKLTGDEYMLFYNQLEPSRPFPKNFVEVRLPWLESTGQAAAIRKKFSDLQK